MNLFFCRGALIFEMSGFTEMDFSPSFFETFCSYVAGSLHSAANVMMVISLGYFMLLLTEYCIGDSVKKCLTRMVEVVKRWLTVLSLFMLSVAIGIKGWENADLTRSVVKSPLEGMSPVVVGVNLAVFLMSLVMFVDGFRQRAIIRDSLVGLGAGVPPTKKEECLPQQSPSLVECNNNQGETKLLIEQLLLRVAKLESSGRASRRTWERVEDVDACSPPVGAGEPRIPRDTCASCGQTGHWRKDCPMKDYRCDRCGQLGHITLACKNIALKDRQGRVKQLVEVKDSRIRTEAALDNTMKDKVMTAQDVLQQVLEKAKIRIMKSKERRAAKNVNRRSKRRVIEHPVAAAPPSDSESSEGSEEEEDLEVMVDVLTSIVKSEDGLRVQSA